MKKMILSAVAVMAFAAASYAQEAVVKTEAAPAAQAQVTADETRTQVDINALPEGVKQALASDQYKDWQLATAWYIKSTAEYYVLEMKKGEEKTTLKLNKDGKPA
jgi:opacity protein-like surface antigen